jgi:hypothetical protein
MSPTISKECFIDPIHDERSWTEVGDTTLSDGLAKARYADRFLRRTNPLEHGEAFRFEFRDGDILHNFSLWS